MTGTMYGYARVSTQMQVEGYSLDAPRHRLLREAKHREMPVAAEFYAECRAALYMQNLYVQSVHMYFRRGEK